MKPTIFRVIHLWPNKLSAEERYGSRTVQIDIPNRDGKPVPLPRELVSLADYEALERTLRRIADEDDPLLGIGSESEFAREALERRK